eukprot:jgi/Mesvir1/5942/Mv00706-RA.2
MASRCHCAYNIAAWPTKSKGTTSKKLNKPNHKALAEYSKSFLISGPGGGHDDSQFVRIGITSHPAIASDCSPFQPLTQQVSTRNRASTAVSAHSCHRSTATSGAVNDSAADAPPSRHRSTGTSGAAEAPSSRHRSTTKSGAIPSTASDVSYAYYSSTSSSSSSLVDEDFLAEPPVSDGQPPVSDAQPLPPPAQPLILPPDTPPESLRGWRVILQSSGEEIGTVIDIVDIEGASPLVEVCLLGIHASGWQGNPLVASGGGRQGLPVQQGGTTVPGGQLSHSQGALPGTERKPSASALASTTRGRGSRPGGQPPPHVGAQGNGGARAEEGMGGDAVGTVGQGQGQGHGVMEPHGLASCLDRTILVPLVADIVPLVDVSARCLHILPPEGLLEMADWKATMTVLNEELMTFCSQRDGQENGERHEREGHEMGWDGRYGCGLGWEGRESGTPGGQLHGGRATRGASGVRERPGWRPQQAAPLMPTEAELQAAGKYELVKMIKFAGGFSSVAQTLGLRWKRRPAGYWDDLENVEREIDMFVRACWTEHVEDETGEKYFFNTATLTFAWSLPWLHDSHGVTNHHGGHGSSATSVRSTSDGASSHDEEDGSEGGGGEADASEYEPEGSREPEGSVPMLGGKPILPTRACIQSAGRFDLHHAINAHGGYHAVRKALGRCPPPRRTLFTQDAFEMEVADVMKAEAIDRFPTVAELIEHDRGELLQEIKRRGGIACVARQMALASARPRPVCILFVLGHPFIQTFSVFSFSISFIIDWP